MLQFLQGINTPKHEVRLTVEEGSSTSGNTVFYEDPTTRLREMSHAVATNGSHNIAQHAQAVQIDAAMPNDVSMNVPTPAMPTSMTERSPIALPTLPITRTNPVKRSGSEDLEGERPARMRTPSPNFEHAA